MGIGQVPRGFGFGPKKNGTFGFGLKQIAHIISHYIIISFSINMIIWMIYHDIPHPQTHPKYPTYPMVDSILVKIYSLSLFICIYNSPLLFFLFRWNHVFHHPNFGRLMNLKKGRWSQTPGIRGRLQGCIVTRMAWRVQNLKGGVGGGTSSWMQSHPVVSSHERRY